MKPAVLISAMEKTNSVCQCDHTVGIYAATIMRGQKPAVQYGQREDYVYVSIDVQNAFTPFAYHTMLAMLPTRAPTLDFSLTWSIAAHPPFYSPI